MDVKTTFLNGNIEEEVPLEQPKGFEVHDRASHVCCLKKGPCMASNMHPELGTLESTVTYKVLDLSRVMLIQTYTFL
jgi:hypothetical protein